MYGSFTQAITAQTRCIAQVHTRLCASPSSSKIRLSEERKCLHFVLSVRILSKKRLGLNISDNCLARLSQEIAKAKDSASRVQNTSSLECSAEAQPVLSKGATAPTVQEVQKPEPAPVEEKPKKKRGRKPKAEKAA